jgi:hypothetical protein
MVNCAYEKVSKEFETGSKEGDEYRSFGAEIREGFEKADLLQGAKKRGPCSRRST